MDDFWNAVWSVTPTILVGLLFWFIMWVIIRADRHERAALSKLEASERERLGIATPTAAPADPQN